MKYLPFSFRNEDGLKIQCRVWFSQKNHPKGTIYLLHSLGEHSARYAYLGEKFSHAGYQFVGFDLRGHGLSEGNLGHSFRFSKLLKDLEQVINQSESRFGFTQKRRVLYGQGVGGNLAFNYILRRNPNISAAIITSIILDTPLTITKIQLIWLQFMANIFPKINFNNRIKSENLSRDAAIIKAYQDDVYNHHKISARFVLDIHHGGRYAVANAYKLDIPILFLHGTSDQITPPSVSKSLAEKVGKMADIVLWENSFHELHNDINKNQVIKIMIEWLNTEIK